MSNPSDNLKNLFEIPVIFYALALVLFVTGQVDAVYVGAAWVFVVFRALHSAVHCTINVIMVRFNLYLVSTLAVWFMAGARGAPLLRGLIRMFKHCHSCGEEYQSWVTECPDCHVPLHSRSGRDARAARRARSPRSRIPCC